MSPRWDDRPTDPIADIQHTVESVQKRVPVDDWMQKRWQALLSLASSRDASGESKKGFV